MQVILFFVYLSFSLKENLIFICSIFTEKTWFFIFISNFSQLYRSSSFNSSGRSSNCDTTEDMYSDVSLEDVQDLNHKVNIRINSKDSNKYFSPFLCHSMNFIHHFESMRTNGSVEQSIHVTICLALFASEESRLFQGLFWNLI